MKENANTRTNIAAEEKTNAVQITKCKDYALHLIKANALKKYNLMQFESPFRLLNLN